MQTSRRLLLYGLCCLLNCYTARGLRFLPDEAINFKNCNPALDECPANSACVETSNSNIIYYKCACHNTHFNAKDKLTITYPGGECLELCGTGKPFPCACNRRGYISKLNNVTGFYECTDKCTEDSDCPTGANCTKPFCYCIKGCKQPQGTSCITLVKFNEVCGVLTTTISPPLTSNVNTGKTAVITQQGATTLQPVLTTTISPPLTSNVNTGRTAVITQQGATTLQPVLTTTISPPLTSNVNTGRTAVITQQGATTPQPVLTTTISPPLTSNVNTGKTAVITQQGATTLQPVLTTTISPPLTSNVNTGKTVVYTQQGATTPQPVLISTTSPLLTSNVNMGDTTAFTLLDVQETHNIPFTTSPGETSVTSHRMSQKTSKGPEALTAQPVDDRCQAKSRDEQECEKHNNTGPVCTFLNSIVHIKEDACEGNITNTVQKVASQITDLINQTSLETLNLSDLQTVIAAIIENVETSLLASFSTDPRNEQINTPEIEAEMKVSHGHCGSGSSVILRVHDNKMEVPCSLVDFPGGGAMFISYKGLNSRLNGSILAAFGESDETGTEEVISPVVGGAITNPNTENLDSPVSFTLKHLMVDTGLRVISIIGLIISLICLFLSFLTLILCRSVRSAHTSILTVLCGCLFLGQLLVLVGLEQTWNKTLCSVIAGSLQFIFLCAFCWMSLESILLFLTVRNLQAVNFMNSQRSYFPYLCLIGFGIPVIIMVISASLYPHIYGEETHCWLKLSHIWSFLGPVCIFISVNFTLLVLTFWLLKKKLASLNSNVSTLKHTRLMAFKAFSQLFILGCTWVIGLFQFGPGAIVASYIFTICNSLQGVYIFIVHCLLNRQVREEYSRAFFRCSKKSTSETMSGSTMPMTLKNSQISEATKEDSLGPLKNQK